MPFRLIVNLILVLATTLVAGCAALLPKATAETETSWKSFEDAKRAYDSIEPGRTTLAELKSLGYDPYLYPNVTVLDNSDVINKYAPASGRDEYLEAGVRECLRAQTKCSAYSIDLKQTHRDRVGNFFLDFVNFKRRTEITGWKFGAVIVIVNDRVAHKSWSGVPAVHEAEQNTNPLGPLQDSGPSLLRR